MPDNNTPNNPVPPEDDEEDFEYCCEDCGEGLYDHNSYYSDYDGYVRCYSCNDSHMEYEHERERERNASALIHYYSYRPTLRFWHIAAEGHATSRHNPRRVGDDVALYMGFELECESRGNDIDDAARSILNTIENEGFGDEALVYLKEDGSLSEGFEIVSHPMTADFYEQKFPWRAIEGLRSRGFSAWNSRSCGLHIHMNRSSFVSDKHLWKFLVFIYKNPSELQRFAGRSSSYAKFSVDSFLHHYDRYSNDNNGGTGASTFIRHAKGLSRNDDRYTAANLQNAQTIELRFFRPSLNTTTVRAALQFCAALHEYTRELATPTVMRGGLKFAEFNRWVRSHESYGLLADRIAARLSSDGDDR